VIWSHPAYANRSVYARNDRELVCVSMAAKKKNPKFKNRNPKQIKNPKFKIQNGGGRRT
jgi:hypothetical protein